MPVEDYADAIREYWRQGYTADELAAKYACPVVRIRFIVRGIPQDVTPAERHLALHPNLKIGHEQKSTRRAERQQEAERLYAEGLSKPAIAERLGLSLKRVRAYLSKPENAVAYPLELRKKAQALDAQGYTVREIAAMLGVSRVTAWRWTRRYTRLVGKK